MRARAPLRAPLPPVTRATRVGLEPVRLARGEAPRTVRVPAEARGGVCVLSRRAEQRLADEDRRRDVQARLEEAERRPAPAADEAPV